MESNKLLEEAKKRYPIGTKFISPDNNNTYTVTLNEGIEETYYLSIDNDSCLATVNNKKIGQYVRYHGRWVKIIEEPIIDEDYQYLIKILKKHGI